VDGCCPSVVVQKALRAPHAKCTHHIYVSRFVDGTCELMDELSQWMAEHHSTHHGRAHGLKWTSDPQYLFTSEHYLLYLHADTWTSGTRSKELAREVTTAMRSGTHVLLAHECPEVGDEQCTIRTKPKGVPFDAFFNNAAGTTPRILVVSGLYHEIAVPLMGGVHRPVSALSSLSLSPPTPLPRYPAMLCPRPERATRHYNAPSPPSDIYTVHVPAQVSLALLAKVVAQPPRTKMIEISISSIFASRRRKLVDEKEGPVGTPKKGKLPTIRGQLSMRFGYSSRSSVAEEQSECDSVPGPTPLPPSRKGSNPSALPSPSIGYERSIGGEKMRKAGKRANAWSMLRTEPKSGVLHTAISTNHLPSPALSGSPSPLGSPTYLPAACGIALTVLPPCAARLDACFTRACSPAVCVRAATQACQQRRAHRVLSSRVCSSRLVRRTSQSVA
jgi:hypothetical protein